MALLWVFALCALSVAVATSVALLTSTHRIRGLVIGACGILALALLCIWALLPGSTENLRDASGPEIISCYVVPAEMPTPRGADAEGCYEYAESVAVASSVASIIVALVSVGLIVRGSRLRTSEIGPTAP